VLKPSTDLANLVVGQTSVRKLEPSRLPSALNLVPHVVALGSKNQVLWTTAGWVIAAVSYHHSWRNWPIRKLVGNPVGFPRTAIPIPAANLAVPPSWVAVAGEDPAFPRLIELRV
jgi:hypothetical protein